MSKLSVEIKISVYERDDNEVMDCNMVVTSHWNRDEFVIIKMGDHTYTVEADALQKAVARCSNWRWR